MGSRQQWDKAFGPFDNEMNYEKIVNIFLVLIINAEATKLSEKEEACW